MQNSYWKTSVVESFVNEIAGKNYRIATLVKKASAKEFYL